MIAPQAQLEFYPVLNEKGIGTVHDFTAVLAALLARQRFRPSGAYLVINLSLLVTSPAHKDPLWAQLRNWLNRERDERDFAAFEAVCHSLATTPGVVLVASAGNEANRPTECDDAPRSQTGCLWALLSWLGQWDRLRQLLPGFNRPEPQYPAAFADVIGVGSVGRDGLPAFYSNLCDTVSGRLTARVVPERNGYSAFGGEARDQGELGVYIGLMPRPGAAPADNASGWARWAGTSFAAPKISGLAALLLATRFATDVDDLNEKLTTHIRSGYTRDGESIVPL
jgi:subtilisin family serine protease